MNEINFSSLTADELDSVVGGNHIETHVVDGMPCWIVNIQVGGNKVTIYAPQDPGVPAGAVVHS